jgi:hypothetical protein
VGFNVIRGCVLAGRLVTAEGGLVGTGSWALGLGWLLGDESDTTLLASWEDTDGLFPQNQYSFVSFSERERSRIVPCR